MPAHGHAPPHKHRHPHGINFLNSYYLNQGAQGWCKTGELTGNTTITDSSYCQWETWFIADVSGALELLDPERVRVLFVKKVAADAVLVYFRLGEPSDYATEVTVDDAAADLLSQLGNASSALFAGNVTVTADPSWGLSGEGGVTREYSPYLPLQVCVCSALVLHECVCVCVYVPPIRVACWCLCYQSYQTVAWHSNGIVNVFIFLALFFCSELQLVG